VGTRAITILAVLALAACDANSTIASAGGVRLETIASDFGQVWFGHAGVRRIALRNDARGTRTAVLAVTAPFALSASQLELPGGAVLTVDLWLTPEAAGAIEGALTLTTDQGSASIPVTAFAMAPPACSPAAACHQQTFDPVSGSCVDSLLADGTSCSGDACVENGQCQAGVCKGTAQTCDDANACTTDSCGADGCIHEGLSCPAPTDPCQVPSCDPKTGCATEEAPDGTRCGPGDCLTAHVCMSGACVVRPVPDGSSCGESTPCASSPTCQAGACIASPSKPLTELWSYAPATGAKVVSFGSQDPAGNFYFLEYAGTSPQIQYSLVSLTRTGALRFKVAAGDVGATVLRGPIDVANQQILVISKYRKLEARSLVDGHLLWSVDYYETMKPLFDRGPGATYSFSISELTLVSAGTAVMNVHEDGGPWRSWAVGLNLLTGQILWSREHPGHLSGFVSNAKGDVFYVESNGWGEALTLFALNGAGVQLWSKPLPTGQYAAVLSLVDGALLFRGVNQWLDATTGNPLGALGTMQAGSLSVGNAATAWVVETCGHGTCDDSVRAFDVKTHQPLWHRSVGDGVGELLLASRGIVLAITSLKGVYPASASTLVAVDSMGAEAFRCQAAEAIDPSAVLDDGQLVGRMGNRIAALGLPKMAPAPSGWISSRGSYLRTGRAR
jgi:outer membrane protein assembly factor BamB